MDNHLTEILELLQTVPTNEQLHRLKEILSDIHNDGYAEAQNLYDQLSFKETKVGAMRQIFGKYGVTDEELNEAFEAVVVNREAV